MTGCRHDVPLAADGFATVTLIRGEPQDIDKVGESI
jgi:hypothetical protein